MKVAEKKAIAKEVERLENENKFIRSLATPIGFYSHYFELLKSSKTKLQAFKKVNKLYFELFGMYRQNNFIDFNKAQ